MVEIGLSEAKHPRKGPREHPKRAKDGPRTLPKPSSAARIEQTRPKRVPRRIWRPSLVAFKTIFGSKMMIFQKPSSRHHKINIFEGRKVSLGAQNRPQEVPKGDKKRYWKKKLENRRKEEHQERQKEFQNGLPPFDPAAGGLQVKENLSSLVARGP